MRYLCGYCRLRPARFRGWCDLCRVHTEQKTRVTVSKIPPVKWYEAPPVEQVNHRLAVWLQEQRQ